MGTMEHKKALIAMSGGVDSSVAAKLIHDRGFACIGCTMKLYGNETIGQSQGHPCCTLTDVEDARSVAFHIGMPFYVFNFQEEFREKVIQKFIDTYKAGQTPNPCIDCNRYLKFDKLLRRAEVLGCDYVVTGHYARIAFDGDRYLLKKAIDPTKDQSYVLSYLTQAQLAHLLFPLGDLCKTQTRQIAQDSGFVNARKHDSQDLCFAPDGDYSQVIARHADALHASGPLIDRAGKRLGTHRGIIHYTLGQRKGLGVSAPAPLYVCGICSADNTVVLGPEDALYSSAFDVTDLNWIAGFPPTGTLRCQVKVRYRQQAQWALVTPVGPAAAHVVFDAPQRAITPGQMAVFYDDEMVLGGGCIV